MLYSIFSSEASMPEKVMQLTLLIMVLSFTFSIHEFMHAFVAEKMGDDTPRSQGRITLNPVAHIDPMGALMMLMVGFGWAKPVQYNPNNLHKYKRWVCERFIALAGVTANYAIGIVTSFILPLITAYFFKNPASSEKGELFQLLVILFFTYLREYNFMFMAFNLLPIPPLDGYRFVSTFIPWDKRKKFDAYSKYSYYVFLALLFMGTFMRFDLLSSIVGWVAFPFRLPFDILSSVIFTALT